MSRLELEDLAWRWRELARSLANRVDEDSSTSSWSPSGDDPYRRGAKNEPAGANPADGADGGDAETAPGQPTGAQPTGAQPAGGDKKTAKPSGKRPGTKGHWRCEPIVVSGEVEHLPAVCEACQASLGADLWRRPASAHNQLELVRGEMVLRVTATKHCYFALRCPCGHETIARPGVGLCSQVPGRKRDLQMSERCLVGPMLATFIAALSFRCRLSRRKIGEFLHDWLSLDLGVATIERCIHEFGRASEPLVEQLIEEVREAGIIHLDETPWYQRGTLLWLWVAVTVTTTVYRIGSRRKDELTALIGEAFLGWLVSDGYGAYRDHPRRQRCLAHYADLRVMPTVTR